MIERFFMQPAVIVHAGTKTNRYEAPIPDWDTATRTDVMCWLGPGSSLRRAAGAVSTRFESQPAGRDIVMYDFIIVLPIGTALTPIDRIEHDGATYEVLGSPHTAMTPDGPHHIEARIHKTEG